ncbi:MAG: transporter [Paludibacteraceae bacterium]|nr:transporter [Paludibacteraceae bacterium]
MINIKKFFDSNALWLSMLIGAVGNTWFAPLKPLLPWLIFFMLFFTFCKVNPLDLRLRRWHWVVLSLQLTLSIAVYYILMASTGNAILAQGMMLCFIMPTATAAPIIAGKLGGSIQNLTTFTLLSNFATAIVVPALFPLIYPAAEMTFWSASLLILSRIGPLLLFPFFAAWLLRIAYNAYQRKKGSDKTFELSKNLAPMPFYLWVVSIIVLFATVTETVLASFSAHLTTIIWLLIGSFCACLFQFGIGKLIGYKMPAPSKGKDYQDVLINPAAAPKTMEGVSCITAGQAFGQKNTSLGVWMAHTYLDPLSSLGAAAYIIWQNIFNSVQLFIAAHKKPEVE